MLRVVVVVLVLRRRRGSRGGRSGGRRGGGTLLLLLMVMLMLAARSLVVVLMRVGVRLGGRRLRLRLGRRRVVVVVAVLMLHVLMGVPQLSVLADQVLHLALQLVDALPLRLDEALLILHDGGELLEVQHGFHGVIQQALHHGRRMVGGRCGRGAGALFRLRRREEEEEEADPGD